MTVDQSEVAQMARFRAMMSGEKVAPEPKSKTIIESGPRSITFNDGPDVDDMKRILETFNKASAGVDTVTRSLVRDGQNEPILRAAMITESTDDGVQIGNWHIRVKQDGKRKFYDVINVGASEPIAVDLTLYEAAYGLAYALSEGKPINSPKVRSILLHEGEYAAALHDAIHHRHSLLRKPTVLHETRRAVIEDRYEVAKQKAAVAKARLVKIVGPLSY